MSTTQADCDDWVRLQVARLLAPLQRKPNPPNRPGGLYTTGIEMPRMTLPMDSRTKLEFGAEVEEYERQAPRRWASGTLPPSNRAIPARRSTTGTNRGQERA